MTIISAIYELPNLTKFRADGNLSWYSSVLVLHQWFLHRIARISSVCLLRCRSALEDLVKRNVMNRQLLDHVTTIKLTCSSVATTPSIRSP